MSMNGIGQIDRWVPEIWNSRLVSLMKKKSFWASMYGGVGSGSAVAIYGDVHGAPGDTIHLPTTAFLSSAPITTDTGTVEGNGEALSPDELQITLEMMRFPVEWTDIAETYSIIDLLKEGTDKIAYKMSDALDQKLFRTFVASHTYNLYGGSASVDSDLDTTDVYNVAAVRKIRSYLEINRAIPLGKAGGDALYGVAIHPRNRYDLITDTTYNNIVQYAQIRGDSNELFTGEIPIVDGLMQFVSHNVPCDNVNSSSAYAEGGIGTDTAEVSYVCAFGAEALARAWKMEPRLKFDTYDAGTKRILHSTTVFGDRRLVEKSSLVGHYYASDPTS